MGAEPFEKERLMIAIDRIRIKGFRSIGFLEMPLSRTTVMIGPNNCGKTTVLKALQLALNQACAAEPHDFHRAGDASTVSEIVIDVRFVPVDDEGRRRATFEPEWRTVLAGGISKGAKKEWFALRRRFWIDPATCEVKSAVFTLSNWETGAESESKASPTFELRICLLEAEDDLQSAMARRQSFIRSAFEALRDDIHAHPQYADVTFEKLRAHLNRLCETLEGPGSGLPDGLMLSPSTLERFFSWVLTTGGSRTLDALLGRGTQKTLLILSAVTLIEGLKRRAQAHGRPLFILIAAEEPESHLHPNAQRTLMAQLGRLSHQLIVSTHSPCVAASAEPAGLRAMNRDGDGVCVRWLPKKTDAADARAVKRLILRLRGEVLFARGLMFVEGVTEEQLIRGMFQLHFGDDPSAFGFSIVGVDGKCYAPFLLLALSLKKPFCIVSDNDGDAAHVVMKQLADVEQKVQFDHKANKSGVFFLSPGLAMEGELVHKLDMRSELIDALLASSPLANPSEKTLRRRRENLLQLTDRDLKRRLEKKKSEYSGFLGDIIARNPGNRRPEALCPKAVLRAFALMKTWFEKPTEKDATSGE